MTREMKKIGSNIDLKGIIIHQVLKEAGLRGASMKNASQVIPITDKEQSFIGKLCKAYYKKSSPIYGVFGDENPKFKTHLNEYLTKSDFFSFSISSVELYSKILKDIVPATGGFLIFSHFHNTDNKHDYMLVLTINNKDGYVVSETDLTIKDIKNLDISKVDVACMINLTKWDEIEREIDLESKTYLSFVKGNKGVSHYFMTFIDCDNKTTSAESSMRLTRAIEAFAKEKGYDRDTKLKKKNTIYQYCEDCMVQKKSIQLSAISALFDLENPNEFMEFAGDERFGVSPIVNGDKAKLKKMKYIMYKGKYTIEFDSDSLGKDVIYNRQKNELTLKKLPQELVDQIPE